MICQVVDCVLHPLRQQPPIFLAPGVGFVEDSPHWPRLGGKVRDASGASHILCPLLSLISSTSDHQALDSGVWGPAVSLRCMTSETQVPNLNDHQSHLWSINIAVSGALRDIPGWIPGICTFEQPLQ